MIKRITESAIISQLFNPNAYVILAFKSKPNEPHYYTLGQYNDVFRNDSLGLVECLLPYELSKLPNAEKYQKLVERRKSAIELQQKAWHEDNLTAFTDYTRLISEIGEEFTQLNNSMNIEEGVN